MFRLTQALLVFLFFNNYSYCSTFKPKKIINYPNCNSFNGKYSFPKCLQLSKEKKYSDPALEKFNYHSQKIKTNYDDITETAGTRFNPADVTYLRPQPQTGFIVLNNKNNKIKTTQLPSPSPHGQMGIINKWGNKTREVSLKKQGRECNGLDNLLNLIELLSFSSGIFGLQSSLISMVYDMYTSELGIELIEKSKPLLDTLFPSLVPPPSQLISAFNHFIEMLPSGNFVVVVDVIGVLSTVTSLVLAGLSIFDDLIQVKLLAFYGIDIAEVFKDFGCPNYI